MIKIINNNKIDLQTLKLATSKPGLFEKSTDKFWDDEHISEQMLKFHLNPDAEAASRPKATIEAEANFIIEATEMDDKKSVIDLGCGPGLYVKEFAMTGAHVLGVDLSPRSVDYATKYVKPCLQNIEFQELNYLQLNYKDQFDIATLIFYDFCALNTEEQSALLTNIHEALKADGKFVFDVVTENKKTEVTSKTSINENGFWSPEPYLEMFNSFMYEDPKTEGLQYTIVNEDGKMRVIRIYHRLFSLEEITTMLNNHNFEVETVRKNLKGEALDSESETFGIIARKK